MSERIQKIFEKVVALPEEQRGVFLDGACGDDDELRREVEELLKAHDEAGEFLGSPTADVEGEANPADAPTLSAPVREGPGTIIGRYKLLQEIGEGGFGVVFMAEQKEPVKRRVALKIIKLGMDTKQVIARFEAERQALAMMDHPNIARVLDAGATDTGRPYFVMELVSGIPILEYCDQEKLDTKERLQLFIQVCNAIQHAHQKGIIHRDIKPSNVLITLHDGVPVVKVIDFGIAKATSAELTEKTLFTQHRQMIGTPAYMSPEQMEMSGLGIDTRSDVYSLGVLLYELLTGTTPFDTEELMKVGFAEMMRMVRETEPHRPSTRLSTLGETATRTAMQRRTDLKKLGVLLRGDLDWIVMRCLEKDRTRRYDAAAAIATDIQRFLNNEPVEASPPSKVYRMQKFIRRNKAGVMTAAVVALALILGIIGTAWGWMQAIEAHREQIALREDAEAARAAEADARREAEAERERAEQLAQEAIAAKDAEQAAREDAEQAADRAMRAEREMQERAQELQRMVEFQSAMLQNIDVALMGERMREDVLEEIRLTMVRHGMDEEHIGQRMQQLAEFVEGSNFTNPAIRVLNRNVLTRAIAEVDEQFVDQPLVKARLLQIIAESKAMLGLGESVDLMERVLELRREALGDGHPETIVAMVLFANMFPMTGDYERRGATLQTAMEMSQSSLGEDHPLTRVIDASIRMGAEPIGGPLMTITQDDVIEWFSRTTPGVSHDDWSAAAPHFREYAKRFESIMARMEGAYHFTHLRRRGRATAAVCRA